jgi:thiamine transport system permease protein
VFFNAPLVARAGLAALEAVPAESHRLAAELGFGRRELWRYLDRPALLAALPGTALLVFLLCAASFTIVLTLGGGPAATTLEVAIYQALRFDFDPARATALALVQLCLCAGLVALSQRFPARFVSAPPLRAMAYRADRGEARAGDGAVILLALLVLLSPLAAVVTNGLAGLALSRDLLAALATSLALGAGSALVSLGLAWPLAHAAARRPSLRRLTTGLVLGGLILPPAVLATGWFLLASRWAVAVTLAPLLVLMLNALMALPFTYTSLAPAVVRAAADHDRLCASLGLSGLPRLARIDLPVLRQPLALAMTMAAIVSLGDLSAITLFGTGGFTTLPALLYRQMGSYRMTGAGGTALVLMALAVTLIALADRWSRTDD